MKFLMFQKVQENFFFGFLLPLLFNFALQYSIKRVQVNQGGFELNGTHQLMVCADDVNILGGSMYTLKENTRFIRRLD